MYQDIIDSSDSGIMYLEYLGDHLDSGLADFLGNGHVDVVAARPANQRNVFIFH